MVTVEDIRRLTGPLLLSVSTLFSKSASSARGPNSISEITSEEGSSSSSVEVIAATTRQQTSMSRSAVYFWGDINVSMRYQCLYAAYEAYVMGSGPE